MPDVSKVETARRTGKGGTKQVSSGDGGVFETIIWEDGWYQWNGSANPHAGIHAKDPNGNVMTILGEVQIYLKKGTWIRIDALVFVCSRNVNLPCSIISTCLIRNILRRKSIASHDNPNISERLQPK